MYGAVVVFYEPVVGHKCIDEMREALGVVDQVGIETACMYTQTHVLTLVWMHKHMYTCHADMYTHTCTGAVTHEQVHLSSLPLAILSIFQSLPLSSLPFINLKEHFSTSRKVSK